MAKGINKAILIGNCVQDPETKYTASGAAVTHISLATSESWKDKQTGQKQEKTEFHRIVFFNRLAEIAGEYLRKGSKVYVEGSLRTNKWKDKDGNDRYTTEIVANQMQMLDSKREVAGVLPAENLPEGFNQSRQNKQQAISEPPVMNDSFDDSDFPF